MSDEPLGEGGRPLMRSELGRGECGCPDLGDGWEYWAGDEEVEELLAEEANLEGQARITALFDRSHIDRASGRYTGGIRLGHSSRADGGPRPSHKPCKRCGEPIPVSANRLYCGPDCRYGFAHRIPCIGCGRVFYRRRPNKRYCTFRCWVSHGDPASHLGRLRGVPPNDPVRGDEWRHREWRHRECKHCGSPFSATAPQQRYCSHRCRRRAHASGGRPSAPRVALVCAGCGKSFERPCYPSCTPPSQPYCNRACYNANRPKSSLEGRKGGGSGGKSNSWPTARPEQLQGTRCCLVCSRDFTPYYITQVCCDIVCLTRHETAKVREQVERVRAQRCPRR